MSSPLYVRNSAWRLVPGRTVHVVIDDQNDFLHPEGWYAQNGIDISHMRRVIEPTKELVAECRRARRPDRLDAARHATASRTAARSWSCARSCATAACARAPGATRSSTSSTSRPEDWYVEKSRLSALLPDEPRARPARPRRRDGADHRRADEPVRRRDVARTRCSATSSRSSSRSAPARRCRICTSRRSR